MRTVLVGFGFVFRRVWLVVVGLAVVVGVAAILTVPHDRALLGQLHSLPVFRDPASFRFARFLGTWGDYPTYNLPLVIVLWLYGTIAKKRTYRRLAVICFLGATMAGGFDDCFRLTLGRPRPEANLPDGFYGLPAAFHARYQSFPSGHAAAVFGTAMSLLATDLPLGAITTLYAILVVWARMETSWHFPSDVLVGSSIGLFFGLLAGVGSRTTGRSPSAKKISPASIAKPDRTGAGVF